MFCKRDKKWIDADKCQTCAARNECTSLPREDSDPYPEE